MKSLQGNIKSMKGDLTRVTHEAKNLDQDIEQNNKKIKLNKQLPHLVSSFMEMLDLPPEDDED